MTTQFNHHRTSTSVAYPANDNKFHPLLIPEILSLIGSYLPLFERRFESRHYRFVDHWNPKHLLRAGAVCSTWHNVFTPLLWQTYDHTIMEKRLPVEVLARHIKLVRRLSLMDKKHKKHAPLWDVIMNHEHINCLEIHDAVFPLKRLMGDKLNHLAELKLSGNCTRMHPYLLIFVQRQVHLQSLELTRFKFTASDWKRIITNKPYLRKLVIAQQCEFLDHKTEEGEYENEDIEEVEDKDNNTEVEDKDDNSEVEDKYDNSEVKDKAKTTDRKPQDSTAMEVDTIPAATDATTINNATGNTTTVNNKRSKKRKNVDDGAGNGRSNKKLRRSELVNTKLPNAKNIGILSITHLVMRDNRLLRPFQKAILEACPHLEQLEICYSQKADGGKVATLVRENCSKLRRLTLRSTRQPWTLAMIEGAPQSVEELILYTGQLDLQMAAAIKDRKDVLTKLNLDFGQGSKGKRRLACIFSILQECSELREFTYHNHAEDKVFKNMMFKETWNLPNIRKLRLHGVSPRAKYGGIPQVPSPKEWRQQYGGRMGNCCSARSFEDVRMLGKTTKSPLFDVELLDHVKDLPMLSEVVISEAIYRKFLD
ncbi:hypothetical protein BGZ96_011884 [Linnemannia gamsii]|uniref:F-box domain-containing protein n=1 Tax=Linnemannia gamsii TaxID=64522 RepID=A0ABQ7JRQ8_9FUNG|nr:hypothetical protein BGZ96_011884 [Linnemannia gamsii]